MRENGDNYWLPAILAATLLPLGVITGCTISFFYYQQTLQNQKISELDSSVKALLDENKAQQETLTKQTLQLAELENKSVKLTTLIKGFDRILFDQLKILLELSDISELTVNSNLNILSLKEALVNFCQQFEEFAEYASIFENALQEEELEGVENKVALLREAGKMASLLGLKQTEEFVADKLGLRSWSEMPKPEAITMHGTMHGDYYSNSQINHVNSPTVNIFNIGASPNAGLGEAFTPTSIPFDPEDFLLGAANDTNSPEKG